MITKQLCIIGGGPAGLAAAQAAYDAGCRDILVLERDCRAGGILNQCIHNGFGLHRFGEELTGPEYAQRYVDFVNERNIEIQLNTMVLDITDDKIITAVSQVHGLQQIQAGAIILAMGCRERPRGAIGIPGSRPAGIYTAGTAQRFVNLEGQMPGKRVVILGSGDIGLIMARRMTFQGAKVLACVELMPYSSGLTRNIVQCLDDYDIPLMLSHTVIDIIGKKRLEAVVVAEVGEDRKPIPGTEQTIECDTLLLSVGLLPENELSRAAKVSIDPATSGAFVDQDLATTVDGIFACGNVLHVHDLVDNVSEESARAGRTAAAYLAGEHKSGESITVTAGKGVRGIVPQRLNSAAMDADVSVMFRPDRVYKKAAVVVTSNGEEISRSRKPVLTPGEMVTIKLTPDKLAKISGGVEFSIEEA